MQHSMNTDLIELLSEAEFKEALEHIVKMKQYLLDVHEKIVAVQRASIELNWMPPYMFEDDYIDDIDGCRRAMYHIEAHVARLTCWVATEEKKYQNVINNRGDKKKGGARGMITNDRLTDKEKTL